MTIKANPTLGTTARALANTIETIRAKVVQPEVLRREQEIASFLAGIKRSSERGEVTVIGVSQVQALRAGLRGYQAAADDILDHLAQIL